MGKGISPRGRRPNSSSILTPIPLSLRSILTGDPEGPAAKGTFLAFRPSLSFAALPRRLTFSCVPSASVCLRARPGVGVVEVWSKSVSIPPKVGAAERRGRPVSVTGRGKPSSPGFSERSIFAIAPRLRATPPPRFLTPPRLPLILPLYSRPHLVA